MARRSSDTPPTKRNPGGGSRPKGKKAKPTGWPTESPAPTKGVRAALYREITAKTRAAYKNKAYKPRMSPYRKKLHAASRQIIEEALATAQGNISRAARNLGVDRDTIYEVASRE